MKKSFSIINTEGRNEEDSQRALERFVKLRECDIVHEPVCSRLFEPKVYFSPADSSVITMQDETTLEDNVFYPFRIEIYSVRNSQIINTKLKIEEMSGLRLKEI